MIVADEPQSTRDCTPVLDFQSVVTQPVPVTPFNIMDALSEAQPSTSLSCNRCPPEKPKRQKIPKEQQVLIEFSSGSCSQESINDNVNLTTKEEKPLKTEMVAKEVQCNIAQETNIKTEGTVDTADTEPLMNEQTEAGVYKSNSQQKSSFHLSNLYFSLSMASSFLILITIN